MIISFVQTKGGTAKSTLSLCIAFSEIMRRCFKSIALVELDAQGTLLHWWNDRVEEGLPPYNISFHHISSTQKKVFQEDIKTVASQSEMIIMDIPGESEGKLHTRFACAVSDMVVIPMRTTTNDESAFSANLYPIIQDIVTIAPKKKNIFFVLPSFTHPSANKNKIFRYLTEVLPKYVTCLDATFPARTVYENFNRDGLTLEEYERVIMSNRRLSKQARAAVNDIEQITGAIVRKMEVM